MSSTYPPKPDEATFLACQKALRAYLDGQITEEQYRDVLAANGTPYTLEQMIDRWRTSAYDVVHGKIVERRFPVDPWMYSPTGLQLVMLRRRLKTQDVLDELARRNLTPATIEQLLAYGAEFPDDQRDNPIVALGVQEDEFRIRRVPVLDMQLRERRLDMVYVVPFMRWAQNCAFLAYGK